MRLDAGAASLPDYESTKGSGGTMTLVLGIALIIVVLYAATELRRIASLLEAWMEPEFERQREAERPLNRLCSVQATWRLADQRGATRGWKSHG